MSINNCKIIIYENADKKNVGAQFKYDYTFIFMYLVYLIKYGILMNKYDLRVA